MLDLKRSDTLEKLCEILLGEPFQGEEAPLAAHELGALGAYECLPHLVKAVYLPDNHLRSAAWDSLGLLGMPTVVPELLPFFREDDLSLHLKQEALLVLGEMPCPEALSVLVPMLISDPEPWVRWASAIALASFEEQYTCYLYPQMLDALLEAFQPHSERLTPFRNMAVLAFQRLQRYPSFQAYLNTIVFSATRESIARLADQPPHRMVNQRLRTEREPLGESTLTVLRRNVQREPERFAQMDPQRLARIFHKF
jgi:hypothetical protein